MVNHPAFQKMAYYCKVRSQAPVILKGDGGNLPCLHVPPALGSGCTKVIFYQSCNAMSCERPRPWISTKLIFSFLLPGSYSLLQLGLLILLWGHSCCRVGARRGGRWPTVFVVEQRSGFGRTQCTIQPFTNLNIWSGLNSVAVDQWIRQWSSCWGQVDFMTMCTYISM